MFDLTRHPRLLKLLHWMDRIKARLQRSGAGLRQADRNLAAFYDRIWRAAAAELGAEVEHLGQGILEIRRGDAWTRVAQNSTSIDDLASFRVVRTKGVMYGLLERAGLPIPRYLVFDMDDLKPAVAFLESTSRPCVVKPANGTGGGMGVVTGIRTRWQLARAAFAASLHDDVLIEEQVEGDNYRLLYLDGKLIDAVLRRPPTVTGDGRSSLLELVRQANADRARRGREVSHCLLTIDFDMKRTLASQGYRLSSVPPAGAVVTVKTAINENSASDNLTATDLVSDTLVEEGARAATLSGLRLAGVDVITRDPTLSLKSSGGVILEVNSPPGYYWHYHKRDGSFPLAVHVLDALLSSCQGGQSDGDNEEQEHHADLHPSLPGAG